MALRVHGQVPAARVVELEAWTARQAITEHVFLDTDAAGLRIERIVPMDEYTIDLVVPVEPGVVLVYDTT